MLDRLRLVPLIWTLALCEIASAAVAVSAHAQGRRLLSGGALLLALIASARLLRLRRASDASLQLVLLGAALLLGTSVAIDQLLGTATQCLQLSLPLIAWMCARYLRRRQLLACGLLAVGLCLLSMRFFGRAEFGPASLICVLFPLALAILVGSRSALAGAELRRSTDAARMGIRSLVQLERRERERFDDFDALSGSWYWETDAQMKLRFVSVGLLQLLGAFEGLVHGRTLVALVRRLRPAANGVFDIADAMQHEIGIRNRHLIWIGTDGRPVVLQIDAWPAYSAFGAFRGYRGRARPLAFAPLRRGAAA